MQYRNAGKIVLFVAAIALISVKAFLLIAPEVTSQTLLPAVQDSVSEAQAAVQEPSSGDDLPLHHTMSSAVASTSGCAPCNQAAAEEECPAGCECLEEDEGTERGLSLCDGERIECVVSASRVAGPVGYCYQTAEEEPACPDHCVCLPVVDGEAAGYRLCDGMVIECALGTRAEHRCYEVKCPDGCVCVTQAVAKARGYAGLCDGAQTLCGYDVDGTPEYCYAERVEDEPVVCREEDISLRQVRLWSGEIRFIADISCPVARVEMIIEGLKVKECAGRYCEYTGGPYLEREVPDFSAVVFDHSDEEVGTLTFTPEEIVVTMPDDVSIVDFDPCPLCPEPEPGWGECVGHSCIGNDHFQAYDSWSNVHPTGCFYEDYDLTRQLISVGGEPFWVDIADPIFDYCINDSDIMLHRCRNNRISQYTYTCPYGCDDGRCVCTKSGGRVVGTDFVDYCIDDKTLMKYSAVVDYDNNACSVEEKEYECPSWASECREEDGVWGCHGTCTDGVQNQGELGIDCGGPCPAACEGEPGWYAQNYGFKFKNPPGRDDLWYGSCWNSCRWCRSGHYGHYKGTFGNCSVCICSGLLQRCMGRRPYPWLYYEAVYKKYGAPAGQCTGMSLSSLAFYYGDRDVTEYDPWAKEVIHLEREGDLKRHIASRQGKIVSAQNIKHFFKSDYEGANAVLNKVEAALSKDPPNYGMIMIIEDNGWGGWENTRRRAPLGHTVVATHVEHVSDEIAKIYVYDSNVPVAENPTQHSPYFNIDNSPYIEIDKQSNTFTFYDDPDDPCTDWDGQLWSNSNNEEFDRIIYQPYSILGGNVDIPQAWDLPEILILAVLGSADAQVEDDQGRILGFSEDGPDAPTIEDGMILPIFGEPDPEVPSVFALPMGDYQINIRGTASDNYSAYIMGGDSPHAFVISDAEVSEGTRDTISIQFGARDEAELSFSTGDAAKQYSLQIVSLGEDNGDMTQTLYSVMDATVSSGAPAAFSVDPASHSLIYTNYGDVAVTYSVQIYRATLPPEGMTQGTTVQPMSTYRAETDQGCTGGCSGTLTATGAGANGSPVESGSPAEGDLAAVIEGIQVTDVYTFTIDPMERHIVSPEDWSDLPASQIVVTREPAAAPNWPLIGGIVGALVIVAIALAVLFSRRRGSTQEVGR